MYIGKDVNADAARDDGGLSSCYNDLLLTLEHNECDDGKHHNR